MTFTLRYLLSKTIGVIALVGITTFAVHAQQTPPITPKPAAYVEKYKEIAIAQMKKYHIPASIILAQGILESASGTSELAVKANNHFGIKCKDSFVTPNCYDKLSAEYENGQKVMKMSPFCKYESVEDCFEAHSKFLQKDNYRSCRQCKDDPCFVRALVKGGYATDTAYVVKVLNQTGKYNLAQYNNYEDAAAATIKSEELTKYNDPEMQQAIASKTPEDLNKLNVTIKTKELQIAKSKAEKDRLLAKYNLTPEAARGALDKLSTSDMTLYNSLTEIIAVLGPELKVKSFIREQNKLKINGIDVVVARHNDFAERIADRYEMDEATIRAYNELSPSEEIHEGDIVFLAAKANQWTGEEATYTTAKGDNWRKVAQQFGLLTNALQQLNPGAGNDLAEGTVLKLK